MRKQNLLLTCEDVGNILIKQNIENITEREQQSIEKHLLSCQDCKKYEYILLKLKNILLVVHPEVSMPDPRIRKNLLKKISSHHTVMNNIWQFILDICEYRIPVYQALGAIAAIFVLWVTFNTVNSTTKTNLELLGNSVLPKGVVENLYYRLDSLQLIERQRIGVNVSEDSILTQFIRPIM